MSLALLGFLTVGAFLALVIALRTPVIVALILVPVVAALAGGHAGELSTYTLDGIKTVAPVCALLMFAVLYFGLMIDVGLFEPLVRRLTGFVSGDPVRLCLVSAALPMLVALDGDGATTFLISITALLPVHRRMGLNPLVLPGIVCLSAGVMNLLPWGGPTVRAMTSSSTPSRVSRRPANENGRRSTATRASSSGSLELAPKGGQSSSRASCVSSVSSTHCNCTN